MKANNRGVAHLFLLMAVLVVLIVIVIAYILLSNSSVSNFLGVLLPPTSEEKITSLDKENAADQKIYESTYWGFLFEYHEEFVVKEVAQGVIFTNYLREGDKKWNYNQAKNELYINISVVNRVFPGRWFDSRESIEKYKSVTFNGKMLDLFKVKDSSPGRGNYSYLAGEVEHDGFTYRFRAEQSDSGKMQFFYDVLASFQLIERDKYYSRDDLPSKGMKSNENTRYGFAFDYPEAWEFRDFDAYKASFQTDKQDEVYPDIFYYIDVVLLGKNDVYPGGLEDIKQEVVNLCSTDGPSGSTSCRKEDLIVSDYVSRNGAVGYEIKRVFVSNSSEGTQDYIVVFPLDLQEYYAIVFTPSLNFNTDDYRTEISSVAQTFQYLKKKPR